MFTYTSMSKCRFYKKQGLKVGGIPPEKNEIVEKIVSVTGLSVGTVREFLHTEFKQEQLDRLTKVQKPTVPASQRIFKSFKAQKGEEYAKELVERHRTEVLAQEKPKIEKEVRTKLLKDPNTRSSEAFKDYWCSSNNDFGVPQFLQSR